MRVAAISLILCHALGAFTNAAPVKAPHHTPNTVSPSNQPPSFVSVPPSQFRKPDSTSSNALMNGFKGGLASSGAALLSPLTSLLDDSVGALMQGEPSLIMSSLAANTPFASSMMASNPTVANGINALNVPVDGATKIAGLGKPNGIGTLGGAGGAGSPLNVLAGSVTKNHLPPIDALPNMGGLGGLSNAAGLLGVGKIPAADGVLDQLPVMGVPQLPPHPPPAVARGRDGTEIQVHKRALGHVQDGTSDPTAILAQPFGDIVSPLTFGKLLAIFLSFIVRHFSGIDSLSKPNPPDVTSAELERLTRIQDNQISPEAIQALNQAIVQFVHTTTAASH
ncbi:hypothetical protein GQ42DRAFT_168680 [Ramicandelaber brevisporus]|nr:hypothetical protein GQ42DRAFT_168680 [Ramicandelaber brevisporus]